MLENLIIQKVTAEEGNEILSKVALDDSLEQEFANQINASADLLIEAKEQIGFNLPVIKVLRNHEAPAGSYAEFSTDSISKMLGAFQECVLPYEKIIYYIKRMAMEEYKLLCEEYKPGLKLIKRLRLKVEADDTVESVRQRNRRAPIIDEMPDAIVAEFLRMYTPYVRATNVYSEIMGFVARIKEMLDRCSQTAKNLRNGIALIDEIKSKPELNKHEADKIIKSLLRGEISASTTRKKIKAIYHSEPPRTLVQEMAPQPKLMQANQFEPRKAFDRQELEMLTSLGFKTAYAKELLERSNYDAIKEFISAVSRIFANRNVDARQAHVIFQKHPDLLSMRSRGMAEYAHLLDSLFDIYNPSTTTGILPRHNPLIYASTEVLAKYLDSKASNVTQTRIECLDKIKNKRDREQFEQRIKLSPFAGLIIKKFISGPLHSKKTAMYHTYSKIAGEGHYRKMPFGDNRRAVFKVTNEDNGKYRITIIEYFVTHPEYSRFLQVR
jgi:hypothetical protein